MAENTAVATEVTNREPRTTNASPCRCLRSKEMYVRVDQLDWRTEGSASGIYWCLHTQNGVGPDAQVAEPATCQPGRACYEAV